MITITKMSDFDIIDDSKIGQYISQKAAELIKEYNLNDLDHIGQFIVTDENDFSYLADKKLEFAEIITLDKDMKQYIFLHTVFIIGDCFAEDIYVPISNEIKVVQI